MKLYESEVQAMLNAESVPSILYTFPRNVSRSSQKTQICTIPLPMEYRSPCCDFNGSYDVFYRYSNPPELFDSRMISVSL